MAADPSAGAGRRARLTYTWGAFVLLSITGAASTVNLTGQPVLVIGVVALLLVARRTVRSAPGAQCKPLVG